MNWIKNAAGRAAGALQGARDAMRGTTYEPLEGRSEVTGRERAVYERWQGFKEPRNAYERTAYESFPREIDAEMDRADQAARENDAARAAEDAEQDARDWEAARAAGRTSRRPGHEPPDRGRAGCVHHMRMPLLRRR